MDDIKSRLNDWEKRDGFVPDIVIVDYADLLYSKEKEKRQRVDEIWMGLRSISQEKHCLMITATQADASSYDRSTIGLKNFSESKRIFSHVTMMCGLNQDPKSREKRIGVMRINQIVVREGEFFSDQSVTVLYDFRIGRAYLESF